MRSPAPRPRSTLGSIGAFVRRWTIPIIGGITPVGLIVINIAVWINDHLDVERSVIAVAAFLSGMILNSWWVLQVYRWVQQRWPHWGVVHERNQEMALVIGMSLVTIYSVLSAVAVFIGLRDTKALPNAFTLWWGVIQIALPFVAKMYFEWAEKRAERRNRDRGDEPRGGPGSPRTRPSTVAEPWTPAGNPGTPMPPPAGGYAPPRYLPPS